MVQIIAYDARRREIGRLRVENVWQHSFPSFGKSFFVYFFFGSDRFCLFLPLAYITVETVCEELNIDRKYFSNADMDEFGVVEDTEFFDGDDTVVNINFKIDYDVKDHSQDHKQVLSGSTDLQHLAGKSVGSEGISNEAFFSSKNNGAYTPSQTHRESVPSGDAANMIPVRFCAPVPAQSLLPHKNGSLTADFAPDSNPSPPALPPTARVPSISSLLPLTTELFSSADPALVSNPLPPAPQVEFKVVRVLRLGRPTGRFSVFVGVDEAQDSMAVKRHIKRELGVPAVDNIQLYLATNPGRALQPADFASLAPGSSFIAGLGDTCSLRVKLGREEKEIVFPKDGADMGRLGAAIISEFSLSQWSVTEDSLIVLDSVTQCHINHLSDISEQATVTVSLMGACVVYPLVASMTTSLPAARPVVLLEADEWAVTASKIARACAFEATADMIVSAVRSDGTHLAVHSYDDIHAGDGLECSLPIPYIIHAYVGQLRNEVRLPQAEETSPEGLLDAVLAAFNITGIERDSFMLMDFDSNEMVSNLTDIGDSRSVRISLIGGIFIMVTGFGSGWGPVLSPERGAVPVAILEDDDWPTVSARNIATAAINSAGYRELTPSEVEALIASAELTMRGSTGPTNSPSEPISYGDLCSGDYVDCRFAFDIEAERRRRAEEARAQAEAAALAKAEAHAAEEARRMADLARAQAEEQARQREIAEAEAAALRADMIAKAPVALTLRVHLQGFESRTMRAEIQKPPVLRHFLEPAMQVFILFFTVLLMLLCAQGTIHFFDELISF